MKTMNENKDPNQISKSPINYFKKGGVRLLETLSESSDCNSS